MPSSLIALRSTSPLAPAMTVALWEIAAALDEIRIPATTPNSIWLEISTKRLRGEGSRPDNHWLKQCLTRLTGITISGEYQGNPWGAVILAEWHLVQGGSVARLLIPPSAIQVLRSPETFSKIETTAAHRLTGHGRRLYAILVDKKRLGRPSWTFDLDELRALLDVANKTTYNRWQDFKKRVLDPSMAAINDYGTVTVKMTPQKLGRAVNAVRFDWQWKSVDEARETDEANEKHSLGRRQSTPDPEAPPLIRKTQTPEELAEWRKKMGLQG